MTEKTLAQYCKETTMVVSKLEKAIYEMVYTDELPGSAVASGLITILWKILRELGASKKQAIECVEKAFSDLHGAER